MSGFVNTDEQLLWRSYDAQVAEIEKADTKANFAVAAETALAVIVLNLLSTSHSPVLAGRVMLGVSLAALAVALGAALLVVMPRLHRPGGMVQPGEFLYFGAVRVRSLDELLRQIAEADTVYALRVQQRAIVQHTKVLAQIAWSKYACLWVSFVAAGAAMVFGMLGVLLGGGR
ncbi:Pycsar system effector family protein [Kribbella sp. NPDC056951]|uniref:Pycsar system effector family protein n=1 Tax=Kribbella sp. NPDC056951 TaxID=3345978 RepID=UPI00362A4760